MSTRIAIEDLVKGQYFLTNSHWYFAAARPIYGEHAVMIGVIEPLRGGYGEVVVYDRVVEVAEVGEVPKPFRPDAVERRVKAAEARILKEQKQVAALRGMAAAIEEIRAGVKS
jgi:hypothetical protein